MTHISISRDRDQLVVVIDAGHGGKDPGAMGRSGKEKNINLAIALKVGGMIKAGIPEARVIYTRQTDQFVELCRRASIANEARADYFISIHCNANRNSALKGAETYVMGLHKSEANLNIAKAENAAILLESDYQASYDGFDPNSDESYIIFSMNQNLNLERSTGFAAAIQEQMEERVGMNNRGVRQAGFLVLYKTTMPSVLVETGYLSNPGEEKFLLSDKGQDFIATAIVRAFRQVTGGVREPVAKADPVPVRTEKADTGKKSPSGAEPSKASPAKPVKVSIDGKLSYRIQIAAETRELRTNAPKFSRFENVQMYRHGGMYKYTVGDEPDLAQALKLLADVRSRGVKDAFVVIFRNGQRIPQDEADRLMKK